MHYTLYSMLTRGKMFFLLLYLFSQSSKHSFMGFQVGSQETSVSDSQISDSGNSENDSTRNHPVAQGTPTVSLLEAQRLISLFFALCTKVCLCFPPRSSVTVSPPLFSEKIMQLFLYLQKPDLLRLVFNIYGKAPKSVKQVFLSSFFRL